MKGIKIVLSSVFILTAFVVSAQQKNQVVKSISVESIDNSDGEKEKSPHGHLLIKEIPQNLRANSVQSKQSGSGIRGTEIIGEGQYLNYNKVIMERSVSGKIPVDFPKHIIGQSSEQYKEVILIWARQNLNLIKPEYHHEIK
ncbi:MAG: hypothetical protein AB7O47_12745 [Flavobacteriales bacterium]